MTVCNREGSPVDPVPFLVVTALSAMVLVSFGPIYLSAFGLPLSIGLAVSGAVTLVVAIGSYHQLVWTHDPARMAAVPAADRFRRLLYAIAILVGLAVLLSIPLFAV